MKSEQSVIRRKWRNHVRSPGSSPGLCAYLLIIPASSLLSKVSARDRFVVHTIAAHPRIVLLQWVTHNYLPAAETSSKIRSHIDSPTIYVRFIYFGGAGKSGTIERNQVDAWAVRGKVIEGCAWISTRGRPMTCAMANTFCVCNLCSVNSKMRI